MKKGKLIVIEGIYGTGKLVVDLVESLREGLIKQGHEVYEIDSPDTGRAQLMGAQDLDCGWRYGLFKPDFFYELASRARACAVIREQLQAGKTVLCKNFTISSIAYAAMKGHDWFREDLNCLEARARGLNFNGEISPDLTIYIDLAPEVAVENLDSRIEGIFTPEDIQLQAACFKEELARLPKQQVGIVSAKKPAKEIAAEALAHITRIL
ncbi:MAG: thymidylate kinase [Desulfuromonas sp.]|nr:thymidylate kinase [Desulfuromonas sp.]